MEEVVDSIISIMKDKGTATQIFDVLASVGEFYLESKQNTVSVTSANNNVAGIKQIIIGLDKPFTKLSAEVKSVHINYKEGVCYAPTHKLPEGINLQNGVEPDGLNSLDIQITK